MNPGIDSPVNENRPTNAEKLLELVTCPVCRHRKILLSDDRQVFVCGKCGASYPVQQGIPDFLPGSDSMKNNQPEIHRMHGTTFDYKDHYRIDADEFDYFQSRSAGTAHSERRVREYASSGIKGNQGKILDVGCGNGWVASVFCKKGFNVVSSDLAHLNVKKALDKIPHENHLGIVADAFSLPFADNTFNYVVASEVIEHVADPGGFVGSLFRVVKPGGSLVVTTPYKEKIIYTLCVHCNRTTPLHAHLHSFDEKILSALYKGPGLQDFNSALFGNKVLVHLRTHVVLRFLEFRLWKLVDKTADLIYKAPSTILAVWRKKQSVI